MKHTLLTTLTIILLTQHSLLAMDAADTHEAAERPGKLTLLTQTPPRFIQITCCNKAPADAFTDNNKVETFKAAFLASIDSVSTIQDAQGGEKSLTMNIKGIAHHPFFEQPLDERTRKLKLLEALATQDAPTITIINGDKVVTYDNEQKRNLIAGILSVVNAVEEDARGLVVNLATLQKLPSCKVEQAAQKETTQLQSSPSTQVPPTWRQKILNPTTIGLSVTCLALGYLLRGQGANQ